MHISLSDCPKLLVLFKFQESDPFLLPISKDFPVVRAERDPLDAFPNGDVLFEKQAVNAEFLPDFLREGGLFLQKAKCCTLDFENRAVVLLEYGRKEKRVRNIRLIRETEMELLGQAVWNLRVERSSEQEAFPLRLILDCRSSYFSDDGSSLDVWPEFVLQKRDGLIILEPTSDHQISAA